MSYLQSLPLDIKVDLAEWDAEVLQFLILNDREFNDLMISYPETFKRIKNANTVKNVYFSYFLYNVVYEKYTFLSKLHREYDQPAFISYDKDTGHVFTKKWYYHGKPRRESSELPIEQQFYNTGEQVMYEKYIDDHGLVYTITYYPNGVVQYKQWDIETPGLMLIANHPDGTLHKEVFYTADDELLRVRVYNQNGHEDFEVYGIQGAKALNVVDE